jgi:hypothetical protein
VFHAIMLMPDAVVLDLGLPDIDGLQVQGHATGRPWLRPHPEVGPSESLGLRPRPSGRCPGPPGQAPFLSDSERARGAGVLTPEPSRFRLC